MNFTKRFWVGCVVLLLSISFLIVSIVQARDALALARDNINVIATVLDTRSVSETDAGTERPSGDAAYYITYTFDASGQTITNERGVPEAFFRAHPVGTTWNITVHPTRPRIHNLYPHQTRGKIVGFVALTAFMALIGAVFALSNGNLATLRAVIAARRS